MSACIRRSPIILFITTVFSTKKRTPSASSQQLLEPLELAEVCGLYDEKVLTSDSVPVLAGVSLPALIEEVKIR